MATCDWSLHQYTKKDTYSLNNDIAVQPCFYNALAHLIGKILVRCKYIYLLIQCHVTWICVFCATCILWLPTHCFKINWHWNSLSLDTCTVSMFVHMAVWFAIGTLRVYYGRTFRLWTCRTRSRVASTCPWTVTRWACTCTRPVPPCVLSSSPSCLWRPSHLSLTYRHTPPL